MIDQQRRQAEEEAEMAIKLLKKSKQRKLLEEVKRTALGIGQDNSWKEDVKSKSRGFRTSIVSTLDIVEEDEFRKDS